MSMVANNEIVAISIPYEPRHEKTISAYEKTKAQIRDQRLCFRYKDSTIPLLPKPESSSI